MSFPNTIQGDYGAWFETGTVALYPLGQRMLCPEGRIFRYCENGGTALVACTLVQAEAENAAHDALAVQTEATAGEDHIHFTNSTAAITENQFQYGYLSPDTANALGVAHRIAANTATGASSTGTVYFFEGDTVQVTLAVTKKITLRKSIYKDIIVKAASALQTAIVVGVPQNAIVANGYGWVQTHGLGGCLTEDTGKTAEQIRPSETVAGAVSNLQHNEATQANGGNVGWMIDANPAASSNANVFFTLEGAS